MFCTLASPQRLQIINNNCMVKSSLSDINEQLFKSLYYSLFVIISETNQPFHELLCGSETFQNFLAKKKRFNILRKKILISSVGRFKATSAWSCFKCCFRKHNDATCKRSQRTKMCSPARNSSCGFRALLRGHGFDSCDGTQWLTPAASVGELLVCKLQINVMWLCLCCEELAQNQAQPLLGQIFGPVWPHKSLYLDETHLTSEG